MHLLKNFVSINSALEVDLTGQVGAEELNGIPVSAIGGQPDLVRLHTEVMVDTQLLRSLV